MEFRWNSRICFGSFHRSALLAIDVAASILFLDVSFVAEMPRRVQLSCGLYKQEYTDSFVMTLG